MGAAVLRLLGRLREAENQSIRKSSSIPPMLVGSRRRFGNNKTFFTRHDDLFLLAVLNSPLMWWHNWRYLPHMKDEALSPVAFTMEELPIAEPDRSRSAKQPKDAVRRLIEITSPQQQTQRTLLDWLRVEYEIEKPSNKLLSPDRTRLRHPGPKSNASAAKNTRSPPPAFKPCAKNTPAPSNPPAPSPPKPCNWSAPSATSSTKPTASPQRKSTSCGKPPRRACPSRHQIRERSETCE